MCYGSCCRQFQMTEKGSVLKETNRKGTNRFGQHESAKAGIILKRVLFKM